MLISPNRTSVPAYPAYPPPKKRASGYNKHLLFIVDSKLCTPIWTFTRTKLNNNINGCDIFVKWPNNKSTCKKKAQLIIYMKTKVIG